MWRKSMRSEKSIATKIACVAGICVVGASHAWAGPVLTFEGLKNFEQVGNYYNGGTGSLGSGPGPNYGISFSSEALAYIPGQQTGKVTPFPGTPSPPTVLLLGDLGNRYAGGYPLSLTMDVTGGFSQSLLYYDIAILRPATVQIWSGLDGTGTRLAQQNMPLVAPSNEVFSGPLTVAFSGTAHSAAFSGGNDQLALDNITFSSAVPEPSSWTPMATGLGISFAIYLLRRRNERKSPP
jgi:hypothetical protein